MPTTAEHQFALVLHTDGTFELIDWPTQDGATLPLLYSKIGTDRVDVVSITSRLDMWLDDEGAGTKPLAEYATRLYGRYQPIHQPYFGTVVLTGGANRHGDTLGLTLDQALELITRWLDIVHTYRRRAVIPHPTRSPKG